MFKPVQYKGGFVGYEYKTDGYHIFFGTKGSEREVIEGLCPYQFNILKQVHGNEVIPSSDGATADGHWTMRQNQALCIRTADCAPVFLVGGGFACALHAGWKGIESDIIVNGMATATEKGVKPGQLKAFVGPHIGPESFEVEADVLGRLQQAMPVDTDFRKVGKESTNENRFLVDLSYIMTAQLVSAGIDEKNIYEAVGDTLTDPQFHSFRRDGEDSGRQISFVSLC